MQCFLHSVLSHYLSILLSNGYRTGFTSHAFLYYVGTLLQPVMASLPGGPQTDKERKTSIQKTKYTHKRCAEEK